MPTVKRSRQSEGALRGFASRYSAKFWTQGGLTWKELIKQLWIRSRDHNLVDRAALLSFYFLLALFPLLIVFSTLVGFILASESGTYVTLINYLKGVMPRAAFDLFSGMLSQITTGATGGKLSFGILVSLWTASSGVSATMQALNIAFEVPSSRAWWRRRAVALALTLGFGALLAGSLLFLFGSSAVGARVTSRFPFLGALSRVSDVMCWLAGLLLLLLSLTVIYRFGPNLKRKRWEGILPGACFALLCWLVASEGLRLYLGMFGRLNQSYGSLAGVIALLFWLYLSAAAIVLGGEINSIIWHSLDEREKQPKGSGS